MLQQIADEIWAQEKDVSLPGGVVMPGRATIIRLPSGSLLVHSPLAIDDATAHAIDALGPVRFLVAPNRLHWMFLKAAKERYSNARVFGAPGLERKLGPFPFEPLPERGSIDALEEEVLVERIEGAPFMTEHAFLHARSRSLIVTDLLFNVHRTKSVMMGLVLRLVGAHDKTAQSRIWRWIVKDRAAAARSVSTVLAWDFDRVVVAHGDVVSDGARERAASALSWMTVQRAPV